MQHHYRGNKEDWEENVKIDWTTENERGYVDNRGSTRGSTRSNHQENGWVKQQKEDRRQDNREHHQKRTHSDTTPTKT
jgi:hypothetical protein